MDDDLGPNAPPRKRRCSRWIEFLAQDVKPAGRTCPIAFTGHVGTAIGQSNAAGAATKTQQCRATAPWHGRCFSFPACSRPVNLKLSVGLDATMNPSTSTPRYSLRQARRLFDVLCLWACHSRGTPSARCLAGVSRSHAPTPYGIDLRRQRGTGSKRKQAGSSTSRARPQSPLRARARRWTSRRS
jgi:hypothetical protein